MGVTDLGPRPGTHTVDDDGSALRLRFVGVPESTKLRLTATGVESVEDDLSPVDAAVISTRLPSDELAAIESQLAANDLHTVVLAHTGAERLAVQLVEAGADAILGEGNEEALFGLIDPSRTPSALLSSFERRFGASSSSSRGTDPVTGLPDHRSFERRIEELAEGDDVPHLGICKVLSEPWESPDPDPAVIVQRRRLAAALSHVAGTRRAELYATAATEFGLLGVALDAEDIEILGRQFVAVTSSFRDRGLPLRAVVGYAGPVSASGHDELLDLARRAVEVAAADGAHVVLGAEHLALGVSVTTELEAVLRCLDQVEPSLPEGVGHGERVGRMTAELARLRGWSPAAVGRAQLAGHLHDVGRIGLPPAAIGGPEGLTGEELEVWRSYPLRSESLLRLSAGTAVATTVRSQRERWDGAGFPDGLRGTEIPETARLLAVAHAIEEGCVAGHPTPTLGGTLQQRAGEDLDPSAVDLALDHLTGLLQVR
jgi:HD-GYP domain-containing protein (c-di-GMP phosphodiesterase class II)